MDGWMDECIASMHAQAVCSPMHHAARLAAFLPLGSALAARV